MDRINGFSSIEQVTGQYLNNNIKGTDSSENKISFEDILNKQRSIAEILDESQIVSKESSVLKFSKHAGNRLTERNIVLSDEQLQRLEDGTQKASAKGIKESLVILDNYSFIVNTNNNTVITAMDQDYEDENIYTNIDGAVII